ncbi:MAG TPA: hypothetical protein VGF25_07880 [Thermoleophilaceae bacterium]|jgi:hypothetical protein
MDVTALLLLLLLGSAGLVAPSVRRAVRRARRSRSREVPIASTWGSVSPDELWDLDAGPGEPAAAQVPPGEPAATVEPAPAQAVANANGAPAAPAQRRGRRRRRRRVGPFRSRKLLALLGYTLAGLIVIAVGTVVLRPTEHSSPPAPRVAPADPAALPELPPTTQLDEGQEAEAEIAAERRREAREAKQAVKARRAKRAAAERRRERVAAGRRRQGTKGRSGSDAPAAPAPSIQLPPQQASPAPQPLSTQPQPASPAPAPAAPPQSPPPQSPPQSQSSPPACDFPPC